MPINTIVGRYCSIGTNVTALKVDHPLDRFSTSTITYCKKSHKTSSFKIVPYNCTSEPITTGHDVWVGDGVKIKQGINIGHGAVIGANSIVTKDIPPYAIAVGSPATIVKYRFAQNTINALIESQWWNYDIRELSVPLDASPIEVISNIRDLKPIKYEPLII
ncbi:TPA: CatB-related O-acetyltransferase [Photobacterium damselae]